jgi:flagellin
MISIHGNTASLRAQRQMNVSQSKTNTALERLSTGLRINRGSDDPAGLIAGSAFRAEKAATEQALSNTQRAGNMISTAEGAMNDVADLINQLQSQVAQVANSGAITQEEKDAAQLEVDNILGQINKVASSSSFAGKKLLDGSLGYRTTGITATAITDVAVNSAKVPPGGTRAVNIAVQTAATRAQTNYTGGTLAVGNNVTLELAGNTGTSQISFGAGTTIAQMATAINSITGDTGVQATVNGANLEIASSDFGSSQTAGVRVLGGTYANTVVSATGTDATVRVNGNVAGANGTKINYRDGTTDVAFTLTATSNVAGQATSFNVTGGGADFMFGSKVNESNRYSMGIQSIASTSLGNATVGMLSSLKSGETNSLSTTNLQNAQKIADAAAKQVNSLRGRLGMFSKYAVDKNASLLQNQIEQIGQAESAIMDADYAQETAALTRSQVLQQAAQSVFASAQQQPQQALALLSLVR